MTWMIWRYSEPSFYKKPSFANVSGSKMTLANTDSLVLGEHCCFDRLVPSVPFSSSQPAGSICHTMSQNYYSIFHSLFRTGCDHGRIVQERGKMTPNQGEDDGYLLVSIPEMGWNMTEMTEIWDVSVPEMGFPRNGMMIPTVFRGCLNHQAGLDRLWPSKSRGQAPGGRESVAKGRTVPDLWQIWEEPLWLGNN